jgi:hypothetical protein
MSAYPILKNVRLRRHYVQPVNRGAFTQPRGSASFNALLNRGSLILYGYSLKFM